MSFKRLFLWFVALTAFVFAVPFVVGTVFVPKAQRVEPVEAFYEVEDRLDAITLGASHGRAVYYPAMGLVGHSLNEDLGDIWTADLKLRAALSRVEGLDFVFMPVSPALLDHDHRITTPENWLIESSWLQNTPIPAEGANMSFTERARIFFHTHFSVMPFVRVNQLTKDAISQLVRRAMGDVDDAIAAQGCGVLRNPLSHPHEFGQRNGYPRHPMAAHCLDQSGQLNAWDHGERAKSALEQVPGIREFNLSLLRKMIAETEAAGAEFVMFVAPMTETYFNDPVLNALWEEERPRIEALAEETGVAFYDFHDLFWGRYREDNQVYTDGNHLTLEGARQFSEAFAEALGLER